MSLHPRAVPAEMEAEAMRLDAMAADPAASPEQAAELTIGALNLRRAAWQARRVERRRRMLRLIQTAQIDGEAGQ